MHVKKYYFNVEIFLVLRKLTYVFHVKKKKKNGNEWDMSFRTVGESGEMSFMKEKDCEPTSCGQTTLAQAFFVVDVPFTCLRALNIISNKVRPHFAFVLH